ncbi:MAG: hypothetical protein NTV43_13030 [Methylococcales bacterium]|nr:hypothetical protein [Methylococcales bacterium]
MNPNTPDNEVEFSIVDGGPWDRGLSFTGLNKPGPRFLGLRLLALWVVCWLPLLIFSAKAGYLYGTAVHIPFLHDFVVHTRFLFTMPLLVIAERAIAPKLGVVIRHFFSSGLIPEDNLPRFRLAIVDALRWKESPIPELVILVLIIIEITSGFELVPDSNMSSWILAQGADGMELTAAGWWNECVSKPILQFLLFRWLWRLIIWANLLRRITHLDLQLFPTHPDHAGGLNFLGAGQAKFGLVILALSAVVAATIANHVLYGGESLMSFKFMAALYVALILGVFLGPLLFFTPKLIALKRLGLLEYSTLATSYVRAFDQKWLRGDNPENEVLLGSGDIQSLADLSTSVENISAMKTFPVDKGVIKGLVIAAVLPFIPLVATVIPLKDLLKQIMGILL